MNELKLTPLLRAMNCFAVLGCVTIIALVLHALPLAQVVSIVGPILLIGTALGRRLWASTSIAQRVGIAVAVGLFSMMAGAGVFAFALPRLGVHHPLNAPFAVVAVAVVTALCTAWSLARGVDPLRECFEGLLPSALLWALGLCVVPLLALVGVARLNARDSAVPAVVAALLALLLTGLAIALPPARRNPPRLLLLVSALIAASWQATLRGGWLFGGDLTHEYYIASATVRDGVFPLPHIADAYSTMLSLTVWPALVHGVSGLSLRTIVGLVPTLALAACLIVTWGTLRERVSPRVAAAICAVFVVGAPSMVSVMPSIGRQCYSLLFLAVLVFAVSSTTLPVRSARVLALVGGMGIVVSHYSTALFAGAAVLVGCLALIVRRTPLSERVLNLPVALPIVLLTYGWDLHFAHAESNVSQVVAAATTHPKKHASGLWETVISNAHSFGPSVAMLIGILGASWIVVKLDDAAKSRPAGSLPRLLGGCAAIAVAVAAVTVAVARILRPKSLQHWAHSALAWVHPVLPSSWVSASVARARDVRARASHYSWMVTNPRARDVRLVNDPITVSRGVHVASSALSWTQSIAGKALLLLAVASVVAGIVACVRRPRMAGLAGMSLCAIIISVLWRSVPAASQYFDPVRLQVEVYVVCAATISVMAAQLTNSRVGKWLSQRWRAELAALFLFGALVAMVVLSGSMGLSNLVIKGQPLDAAFSSTGEQTESATTPSDLAAAQWLAAARPSGLVQSDWVQGILQNVGYATRREYIPTLDPVLTDERSWVFVSQTNLVRGRVFGGTLTYNTSFRLPLAFLSSTRPILFTSGGAVVFGSEPHRRA